MKKTLLGLAAGAALVLGLASQADAQVVVKKKKVVVTREVYGRDHNDYHPGHRDFDYYREHRGYRPYRDLDDYRDYYRSYGTRFGGSYYFAGRDHCHWDHCTYNSRYGRYQYYEPSLRAYFYYDSGRGGYYPCD